MKDNSEHIRELAGKVLAGEADELDITSLAELCIEHFGSLNEQESQDAQELNEHFRATE